MPNFYYNYLSTPDYADPLFRAKMAAFGGYIISFGGAAAYFSNAALTSVKVRQTGIKGIRWILTGMAVGVTHAAISYISSRASGNTDSWVNHAIGGAAAGFVGAWRGNAATRISGALAMAAFSACAKAGVQMYDQNPNVVLPKFGELNPSPYISLNHRWMNKEAAAQEAELDSKL